MQASQNSANESNVNLITLTHIQCFIKLTFILTIKTNNGIINAWFHYINCLFQLPQITRFGPKLFAENGSKHRMVFCTIRLEQESLISKLGFHGRTFNSFHSTRVVPDLTRPWGPFDSFSRPFDSNTLKISLMCIIS